MNASRFAVMALAASLFAALLAEPGLASEKERGVNNTSVIPLSIDESSIRLGMSYPGSKMSGLCGIEVRTDEFGQSAAIQDLYKVLQIENVYQSQHFVISFPNEMTLRIDLAPPTVNYYVAGVRISTRDGSPLKTAIESALGKKRTVIIIGATCPSVSP